MRRKIERGAKIYQACERQEKIKVTILVLDNIESRLQITK